MTGVPVKTAGSLQSNKRVEPDIKWEKSSSDERDDQFWHMPLALSLGLGRTVTVADESANIIKVS